MIMLLLYFILYAMNTNKNYDKPGTNRAIWLSQSFSRDYEQNKEDNYNSYGTWNNFYNNRIRYTDI